MVRERYLVRALDIRLSCWYLNITMLTLPSRGNRPQRRPGYFSEPSTTFLGSGAAARVPFAVGQQFNEKKILRFCENEPNISFGINKSIRKKAQNEPN